MAHLHGIGILPLGTIQLNRAKDIDLPSKKELLKYERGHCIEKSTEINGVQISVTTWVDNKVVNLCSSYDGKEPMAPVKRFSKKEKRIIEVPRPKSVEIYNKYMGGVDLLDAMLGFYRIKIKSKKWYHRIFFHMVDMTCVNSWLLWRRRNKQKSNNEVYMPLLDFKIYIADVLMRETGGVFTPTTRGRGRPALEHTDLRKRKRRIELPPQEVVYDAIGHWPNWGDKRQRCKNCTRLSYIDCSKCDCFFLFKQRT